MELLELRRLLRLLDELLEELLVPVLFNCCPCHCSKAVL
jgi:hypothetical protein